MKLSLVVIEYKSIEEIGVFIEKAQEALVQADYEIIISSNSLYDNAKRDEIMNIFQDVRWVFNERNGGFAYGMNEGLKVAKGEVLIVVNPDVKILSSLTPMISYLQSHLDVGLIGPKIIDNESVIQDSFRHFVTPWGFFVRQVGRIKDKGELHEKNYQEPVSIDWVIGAFMMCRRDFYNKVGGLSDDYFMYCEDMDWCMRAHKAGYSVVYYPEAVIEYKGTRAARKSMKYALIHIKSLLTFWRKYGISFKIMKEF